MARTVIVYNRPEYLTEDTIELFGQFFTRLKAAGLNPRYGETYRKQSRQDELYNRSKRLIASGRAPLTKTPISWHTARRAADIDISPVNTNNILLFLDTARALGLYTVVDPVTARKQIAAGKAPELWDWHHIENRGGRTLNQALTEAKALESRVFTTAGGSGGSWLTGALAIGTLYGVFNARKR